MTTDNITVALVTGTVLSMCFSTTRKIGIIAISLLAYLYPYPVLAIVLVGVGYFFFKNRK